MLPYSGAEADLTGTTIRIDTPIDGAHLEIALPRLTKAARPKPPSRAVLAGADALGLRAFVAHLLDELDGIPGSSRSKSG